MTRNVNRQIFYIARPIRYSPRRTDYIDRWTDYSERLKTIFPVPKIETDTRNRVFHARDCKTDSTALAISSTVIEVRHLRPSTMQVSRLQPKQLT